ncbi:glycosyltransferase [Luteimonas sp. MC1782]|uniref:glycosyltransferase n=1 Tax=Luteimonas sp. MC1782 TaxID=2760305 RepID=UPI0016032FE4|nr:glycosyltransferase [Luteimonas sp. MC1782]MBB1472360.1 glycosyltransferase [Luteimonas sp. MC1782]
MQPIDPTRKLAIVHVVDSLELGGLERVVADLAIAQSAHGHRVLVFSINDTGGFRAELEAAGVPVVIGGKRGPLDIGVLRALRSSAGGLQADIVHTHNFVPSYYAALALLFNRHATLVNTCHNMGARLANRRLRTLYRWSLARTRRVAMVGQQVHDQLVASGIARANLAEVVHNGIPLLRHADPVAARDEARAAFGLAAGDAPVIGCVGRLVELKNQRIVLEQVPALLAGFPRLKLVMVGDGPLAADLRARADALGIADRVLLAGPRGNVPALLPAFDVFALPSLTEGLSIALLEACAAGLAIVAGRVGGNVEIISDGDNGRLFAPTDGTGLQGILRELLGDDALRVRLGTAARQRVELHGSVDVMRARYDAFYQRARGGTETALPQGVTP